MMASIRIAVRLTPRAGRDEIVGLRDDMLLVRVRAPPVDGRANTALRRLIARRLGLAPSSVKIVQGEHARHKVLRVDGLDARALRRGLGVDGER